MFSYIYIGVWRVGKIENKLQKTDSDLFTCVKCCTFAPRKMNDDACGK